MPRSARQVSQTGIYHVTSRGAGRRILFEEPEDYRFYRDHLRRYAEEEEVSVLSWCLMDNHVHILCKAKLDDITKMMKRLNTSYAVRFNGSHGHVGPVFQGRFSSFPIESESHLMDVVRYIHRNPKDLGIKEPLRYEWSSYSQYMGGSGFCSTRKILDIFDGIDGFADFHNDGSSDVEVIEEPFSNKRLSDAEARRLLYKMIGNGYADLILQMNKVQRNKVIKKLYVLGISVRQLERLTGIGRNTIHRAVKE